jgi:hypothetical protein
MGLYGDAPEQKDYGEATAETIQAQYDFITGTGQFEGKGLIDMLPAEIKARGEYQDAEIDLLTRQLLGEIKRTDEQGRYVSGQRYLDAGGQEISDFQQITDEADRGRLWLQTSPHIQAAFDSGGRTRAERTKIADIRREGGTAEDFAKWHRDLAQTGTYGRDEQDLSQFVDEPHRGAFQQQLVEGTEFTEEPVYIEGKPGTIASREGGVLDLYGGNTKVRQFSQAKYQENLDAGMGEEEAREAATTWGTAGFDPDTGEFKGLIPMMQEAQAYIASQQRESDISDVEAFGGRATEAIRSQGDIQEVLDNIERQVAANEAAVDPLRKQLLTRANELANAQLSDREKQQLEQLMRSREAAGGRLRDYGAGTREVQTVMEEDWNRGMQGALAGGQLMAGESAMQTNLLGQLMTRMGVEQATSADPFMAILGRPSQAAPTAQSVLSTGAGLMAQSGPEYINPESGLPYISNQYTNEANMYAADQAATASMVGGVFWWCWRSAKWRLV